VLDTSAEGRHTTDLKASAAALSGLLGASTAA
jgi:hypothetical protein